MSTVKFDRIRLNLKPDLGQLRFIPSGIGWKPNDSDQITTIHASDIARCTWSHASRGYELKIQLKKAKDAVRFDGFSREDYDTLREVCKKNYHQELIRREYSLRGYNWGKTELTGSSLSLVVDKKPAFEIPLEEVANTSLAGKNEVSIEFLTAEAAAASAPGGRKRPGEKIPDQLVEMRFYVPGTVTEKTKKAKLEEGQDVKEMEEGESDSSEVQSAAAAFHELLKARAEVGNVAGGGLVLFQEILCLTPRGRYEVEMFQKFFRLRGKTNDYKIMYSSVKHLFSLKKPDEIHGLFVIGLDPPLRQGQTRYPFLVLQFPFEDDIDVTINMEEDEIKKDFGSSMKRHYEGRAFDVVGAIFSGLTKRSLTEGAQDYQSHHGQQAMKCSMKANEGYLYPLDKCFLFIPKPPLYVSYSDVSSVVFSRVGSGTTATSSRMFDIRVNMVGGSDFQFSNISKEEYQNFRAFLKLKRIKSVDEQEDLPTRSGYAELSEDDEVGVVRSGDESDESPDEDFIAESESDVGEEYNEDYSGGSSSENEDGTKASSAEEGEIRQEKKEKKQASVAGGGSGSKKAKNGGKQ